MGKKKIISLNIDKEVYSKYSKMCKEEGIIMSKQVEKFMKKKLEEEDEE
jgi:antitoxin component of RelBE/YafQ-DinJ toxin-antitoxin module